MDIGNNKNPLTSDSTDNLEVNSSPSQSLVDYKSKLPETSPPRLMIPLAGLFLALILLSGAELTLNNVQVALISHGDAWSNKQAELQNQVKGNLALVETLIDDRALDVTKGYSHLSQQLSQFGHEVKFLIERSIEVSIDQGTRFRSVVADGRQKFNGYILSVGESGVQSVELGLLEVENTSNQLGNHSRLLAASIGSGLMEAIGRGWNTVKFYLNILVYNLSLFADGVAENWRSFIGGGDDQADVFSPTDEAALREQIKQEILAELETEIQSLIQGQNITEPTLIQGQNGQGLVVVPDSGTLSQDQVKTRIKNMFSDEVTVNFDASGQSGVITPIFRQATGSNYIFVLTPVAGQ